MVHSFVQPYDICIHKFPKQFYTISMVYIHFFIHIWVYNLLLLLSIYGVRARCYHQQTKAQSKIKYTKFSMCLMAACVCLFKLQCLINASTYTTLYYTWNDIINICTCLYSYRYVFMYILSITRMPSQKRCIEESSWKAHESVKW